MKQKNSGASEKVNFQSKEDIADLKLFLKRLEASGEQEVVLKVSNAIFSVFGCILTSSSLTRREDTVLVHRAFKIDPFEEGALNRVVPIRSVLDRLAHQDETDISLLVPDATINVSWAGVLPPQGGWEFKAPIAAESLATVAKQGIERVAELMPKDPGMSVVTNVRESVWGQEILPGLKAGSAFALEVMGFLDRAEVIELFESKTWKRLRAPLGDVLVRPALG